ATGHCAKSGGSAQTHFAFRRGRRPSRSGENRRTSGFWPISTAPQGIRFPLNAGSNQVAWGFYWALHGTHRAFEGDGTGATEGGGRSAFHRQLPFALEGIGLPNRGRPRGRSP